MTHGSLFSGGGGFDLAAQWAGWENLFNCEIAPFCQRILKYYLTDAEQYGDIRTTDFTVWRGLIDVLSGGFPCQPFSTAGKRKGTEDNRYLWPEMLRAIREIRPRWVVGENVLGIVSWSKGMVFEQVCADLEAEGYQVQPYILPAAGVGAPHRRDRVWFVAYRADAGTENVRRQRENAVLSGGFTADTENSGYWAGSSKGCEVRERGFLPGEQAGSALGCSVTRSNRKRFASNSDGIQRPEGRMYPKRCEPSERYAGLYDTWKIRNAWQDFPTQSPVCCRNDGISCGLDGIAFSKWRKESVKVYGNAVVPQVVLQIFETINMFETL